MLKCCHFDLMDKLQWNQYRKNHSLDIFQCVVCKISAILFRPQCILNNCYIIGPRFSDTHSFLLLYLKLHQPLSWFTLTYQNYRLVYHSVVCRMQSSRGFHLISLDILSQICGREITAVDYFHGGACQPPASVVIMMLWGILVLSGKIAHQSPWITCLDRLEYG